jgi:hypothetical protein
LKKRRRLEMTAEKFRHVHSHIMESGSPEDAQAMSEDDCVQKENGTLTILLSVVNYSVC